MNIIEYQLPTILMCFFAVIAILLAFKISKDGNHIIKLRLEFMLRDLKIEEAYKIWLEERKVVTTDGWYGINPFMSRRLLHILREHVKSTGYLPKEEFHAKEIHKGPPDSST